MRRQSLLWVRGSWIALALLSLAVLLAGMPAYYRTLNSACLSGDCIYFQLGPAEAGALVNLNLSLRFYAAYMVSLTTLLTLVSLLLGTLIFLWQSKSRIAIFLSYALLALGPTFFQVLTEALVKNNPAWRTPVSILQAIGVWTIIVFAYLFPDGRFYPRWTRVTAAILAITVLLPVFTSEQFFLGSPGAFGWYILSVIVSSMLVGAFAQIIRYRKISGPVEKQQVKWVVFGFALFALQATGYLLSPVIYPPLQGQGVPNLLYYLVGGSLNVLFLLFFLSSLAIAILRYRLWEIDVIIRRTLQYSLLTGLLALLYLGGVIIFQQIFDLVSVEAGRSPLAIVLSTLAIAALFTPLRARIQAGIDRRFYRRKYDAERTLERFAGTLREEVDVDRLSEQLISVVQETVEPEMIELMGVENKGKSVKRTAQAFSTGNWISVIAPSPSPGGRR